MVNTFLVKIECDSGGNWSVEFQDGQWEEGLERTEIIKILDLIDSFIEGKHGLIKE
jgi:hypothetical protein